MSDPNQITNRYKLKQTHKARAVLDDAFTTTTCDDAVLFELTVSKTWLHQVIVALALICHSSYRGIIAFLRDLLGVAISVGAVHDVLQAATRQAGVINRAIRYKIDAVENWMKAGTA
jgi:hypothetical protein